LKNARFPAFEFLDTTTTPGTPHGDLYGEALQKREFVYAAYNKGDWAETARLARQNLALCEQLSRAFCVDIINVTRSNFD